MKNYNKLKKVIQEANPDSDVSYMGDEFEMKIKLADVLMAMDKKCKNDLYRIGTDGAIGVPMPINPATTFVKCFWNLSKDLDNQTDRVKEFLIELLVTDK